MHVNKSVLEFWEGSKTIETFEIGRFLFLSIIGMFVCLQVFDQANRTGSLQKNKITYSKTVVSLYGIRQKPLELQDDKIKDLKVKTFLF